ncbi:hypothetical protein Y032_0032g2474 [Ancylostoma ceylanicum]|uniref:Reverse transcriptase domain-containing protein n=1 Tax=Ancylostoma ceylanicum TaxID=53326 RepID=A0A016UPF2_9BILA|nr:hypothetical protein Y032_0032g2474 [Ancylostoma ceylanicum]
MNARWTWRCAALSLKKEIDYVLVRNINDVKDVGVLTSINAGSDHRLLRCILKTQQTRRLARPYQGSRTVNKLLLRQYVEQQLTATSLSGEVNEDYGMITSIINAATDKATSYVPLPPRISQRTEKLFALRKNLRYGENSRKQAVEYAEVCKLVRKSLKQDLYLRHLKILEKAVQNGRIRIGRQENTYTRRSTPLLVRNPGEYNLSLPADFNHEDETIEAVKSFYNELYSSSFGPPLPPPGPIDLRFLPSEVEEALKTSKTRAAPGSDRVQSCALRPLCHILARPLCQFLNKVISTKTVPKELAYADTILLYKKGDSRDVANYRPISLLSTIYKVMTKILCRRLEKVIDELSIFPPEQAGFRKNFSAVDHIHTLDTILEKSYEYNVNLCLMFVDFTKAFDRVELPAVWQALETFGIEQDLIRVIQLLYANGTAAVKVGSRLAEINIQRGVRQGDSLSPLLFILTLQCALNNIRGLGKGFRMNGTMLTYLAYADDVVLLAHDCEELQALADALVSETSRIGLAVNISKTKWMKNSRAATDMEEESIEVNGEKIERVVEFVYLGHLISSPRNPIKALQRRIQAGREAYFKYRMFLRSSSVAIRLKRKLIHSCILPAVLYSCETWVWTREIATALRSAQRRLERSILGIRLSKKISAIAIRRRTGLSDWIHSALQRKWIYAKKLANGREDSWALLATNWMPEGSRCVGRPRTRWLDDIAKFKGCRARDITSDWVTLMDGDATKNAELFARTVQNKLCRCDVEIV